MTDTQKLSRFCDCGAPWVEVHSAPREVRPASMFSEASVAAAEAEGWRPDGYKHFAPGFTRDYKCDRGHWITVANTPVEWIEPALTKDEWIEAAWREPGEVAGGEFHFSSGA